MSSLWLAAIASVLSALVSVVSSIISWRNARKAVQVEVSMFRRQHVIDLHNAWQHIMEFDKDDEDQVHDAYSAAYAMNLTATCWVNDIVDKKVIEEMFFERFRDVFCKLDVQKTIPGKPKTYKDLITPSARKAYDEMNKRGQPSDNSITN